MAELRSSILPAVVQACQVGALEAAAALGRALNQSISLAVGPSASAAEQNLPGRLTGAGLVVVLHVGGAGALVLIPESSGLLPSWCPQPDATGKSKLTTLAQELGMVLLPEDLMPEDFAAAYVADLRSAWRGGEVASDAAVVALELGNGRGNSATAYLVWPAAKPAAALTAGPAPSKPAAAPKPAPAASPAASAPRPRTLQTQSLPLYARSLLKIKVPVVVTLAQKHQRLSRIMELGPGSIIQFDKSCEEMLDLDVGGHRVAVGEAVKVGDKFGLRVSSIVLPEERFVPVRKERS